MATYQYFTFSYANGADQAIATLENVRGMKLQNLQTSGESEVTIKAKSDATNFTIINKIKLPVGAFLVLDEDSLGLSEATGFKLFFQMNTAAGSVGVSIKY